MRWESSSLMEAAGRGWLKGGLAGGQISPSITGVLVGRFLAKWKKKRSWLILLDRSLWTPTPLEMHGGKVGSGIHERFCSWVVVNQLLSRCGGWCWHNTSTRTTWWGWSLLSEEKTPVGAGQGAGCGASREQLLVCICAERGGSLGHATGGWLFLVAVPGTPCG